MASPRNELDYNWAVLALSDYRLQYLILQSNEAHYSEMCEEITRTMEEKRVVKGQEGAYALAIGMLCFVIEQRLVNIANITTRRASIHAFVRHNLHIPGLAANADTLFAETRDADALLKMVPTLNGQRDALIAARISYMGSLEPGSVFKYTPL